MGAGTCPDGELAGPTQTCEDPERPDPFCCVYRVCALLQAQQMVLTETLIYRFRLPVSRVLTYMLHVPRQRAPSDAMERSDQCRMASWGVGFLVEEGRLE